MGCGPSVEEMEEIQISDENQHQKNTSQNQLYQQKNQQQAQKQQKNQQQPKQQQRQPQQNQQLQRQPQLQPQQQQQLQRQPQLQPQQQQQQQTQYKKQSGSINPIQFEQTAPQNNNIVEERTIKPKTKKVQSDEISVMEYDSGYITDDNSYSTYYYTSS